MSLIRFIFLFSLTIVCFSKLGQCDSAPLTFSITSLLVEKGKTASILLSETATYRRIVKNGKGVKTEHLYRVCNGKNKTTCGYWQNVKTKKKVASGATSYNKKKRVLVVKKFRATDAGTYMTGNKNETMEVSVYSN
ncbi:unnamed protein product [Caenorhabditis sp. 36 PRJEB53466]|nr:unnamed protein product [Caenorhabditis sp. 36 PRJEB53466]